MKKMNVFTDGSYLSEYAGWSYVITDERYSVKDKYYGKLRKGVQNSTRAELEAMYQAFLHMKKYRGNTKFTIYCDCETVVEGITGMAKREGNRDLWEKIEPLCKKLAGKFKIIHINSHQKAVNKIYELNAMADKLARAGSNSLMLLPAKN